MRKITVFMIFSLGFVSLFAEETTVTTTTTIKTDGQTTTKLEQKEHEKPATPSMDKFDHNSAFRSQFAITRMLNPGNGLELNSTRIEEKAKDLNTEQKYMLLNFYKKDGGVPFVLNLVLGFGIGSFMQGDTKGGITGLVGELGSYAVITAGYIAMFSYSNSSYMVGTLMIAGGLISLTAFRVYELVRPWTYARSYNDKLEQSLLLSVAVQPYMSIAQGMYPIYGAGVTARF